MNETGRVEPAAESDSWCSLTPAQTRLLQTAVLIESTNSKDLARALSVSPRTVDHTFQAACRTLGVPDRLAAILQALKPAQTGPRSGQKDSLSRGGTDEWGGGAADPCNPPATFSGSDLRDAQERSPLAPAGTRTANRAADPGAHVEHCGRRGGLSAADLRKLVMMLACSARAHGFPDDTWTCKRVSALIRAEFGLSYSRGHVCRLLQKVLSRESGTEDDAAGG